MHPHRVPAYYKLHRCCGTYSEALAQNFGANVMQMQLEDRLVNADGSISSTGRTLDSLDMFFTLIFTVELGFTMFAHWFREFFMEGWNWCAAWIVALCINCRVIQAI